MSKKEERIFEREKETKNTIRFSELEEEGKPFLVKTIYLQKWFAKNLEKVKVSIEEVIE